jgi:hypothetical protein
MWSAAASHHDDDNFVEGPLQRKQSSHPSSQEALPDLKPAHEHF